ncbi:hypothetical protein CAPTEDRAFT_205387 [Capitella teleta]|uniref:G-protein coupled receptors family 1 profile domain-containing protein n=1 Tax=Capitella teleta TaxID=283909 RepID=R7TM37_CAPTE|nr:hypothetical protein CAPTEDRAFT_205387 [Capitella teleta]|eukprot:ELT94883.1 hypothetical protein CAPTEDRAFT_205387 [Capitella teleta]
METTGATASTYLPELIPAVQYNLSDWSHWILLHIEVVTMFGLVLNSMVIVACLKSNLLHNERPAFKLIFNLALTDFFSTLFVQPIAVFYFTQTGQLFIHDQNGHGHRLVNRSDLHDDVRKTYCHFVPFLPPEDCDQGTMAIISSWLWLFGKNFILFIWNDLKPGDSCSVPNVMADIYIKYIYSTVQYGLLVMIALGNFLMLGRMLRSKGTPQGATQQPRTGHHKMIKMVLVIVASLFFCWLPFMLASNVVAYLVNREDQPPKWLLIVYDITRGMPLYSTVLDPMIYMWQIVNFRKAALQTVQENR